MQIRVIWSILQLYLMYVHHYGLDDIYKFVRMFDITLNKEKNSINLKKSLFLVVQRHVFETSFAIFHPQVGDLSSIRTGV